MLDLRRSRLRPALTISLISMIIVPTYASAHLGSDPRIPVVATAHAIAVAAADPAGGPGRLDRVVPPRALGPGPDEARRDRLRSRRAAAREKLQRIREAALASASSRFGLKGVPDWTAIADCESGGRWDTNSSNGFWGGLQFTPQTWFVSGGGPFQGAGPFPYTRMQQIAVAWRVYATQGPFAWPSCFQWK